YLATFAALVSFVCACIAFFALWGDAPHDRSHYSTVWTWLQSGSFSAGLRILVDPLSTMMMLIVSGVGSLIVAYSVGYMDGDDEERLDFDTVSGRAPGLASNHWLVNLVALGLLGGAVAKSAQLPLQTWLPDAMEGPTPVSALIHAATMVTAGVYLIVRTHVLFELAPKVEDLAAGLGAATLLMAGLIALVQTDIKRVIAYSTMSQIGYMFLGAGLGAYANGM